MILSDKPYISLECRWFFSIPLEDFISEIFEGILVDSRTDTYWIEDILNNPGAINDGIKLREGRFEVKKMLGSYHDPMIPGTIQKWQKTSREIPNDLGMSTHWLNIGKNRQLLLFAVEDHAASGPVHEFPENGCQVELTRFDAPLHDHWTIGFEAFGKDDLLMDNLKVVFLKMSRDNKTLVDYFKKGRSESYPEWLARIKDSLE